MQTSGEQQMEQKPVAAMSTSAADATAAIAAAEQARKAADAVGYEWRDTAKLIKQAKRAATKKDFTQAIKLANKAKKQGDDAVAQYHEQKNVGAMN